MNSKIRKGIAINSLLVLTGALLFAGLMGTLYTESPLAEAMLQGVGLVDQEVDDRIEVESRQQLSDIAKLSFDRASDGGCAEDGAVATQNEDGGYPGLSDTYLTATPECWGAESTYVRGASGAAKDEGNDMEGLYSRIEFEISEDRDSGISLETNSGSELWLENNLLAAANEPYQNRIPKECDSGIVETLAQNNAYVKPISTITDLAPGIDEVNVDVAHVGTANYVLYFDREVSDDRVSEWISNELEDITYCNWAVTGTTDLNINAPVENVYSDRSVSMILCPGDKGYVQVNKGYPFLSGEAGETNQLDNWKFPRMVITEAGEECGNIQSRIPDEANSKGNIFRITVSIKQGWETLVDADLHQVEDEKRFYDSSQRVDIAPDQDKCVVYVRDDDVAVSDNGVIHYRTGSVIGHDEGGSFPDFDGPDVYTEMSFLDGGNLDTGQTSEDYAADTIYLGTNADDWTGLETEGFTGEEVNNDFPFLKNVEGGSTSTFEPYGDLLCFQPSGAENAKWMVCDESNYGSSSVTADVERNGNTLQYTCTPGTGEWDLELEDPYEDNPNVE